MPLGEKKIVETWKRLGNVMLTNVGFSRDVKKQG